MERRTLQRSAPIVFTEGTSLQCQCSPGSFTRDIVSSPILGRVAVHVSSTTSGWHYGGQHRYLAEAKQAAPSGSLLFPSTSPQAPPATITAEPQRLGGH